MKIVKFGDVCSIINGGTPKTGIAEYWDGDILWITPRDLGKVTERETNRTDRKITQSGIDNSSAKVVPIQSVILSTRAPIGHVVINAEPMAFNQGCRGLVPGDTILAEYLYYFLKLSKEKLNELGTGTTFRELSAGALKNVEIPLLSLEEQRQVVERLDAAFEKIDRAIELTEKNIEKINSLRLVATRNLLERVDGQEKTVGEVIKLEYGKPLDRVDRKRNGKFAAYGANGIKDMTDRYYWDVPSIIIGRKGSAGELTRVDEPFWPLDVTYYVTHDNTETNLDYIFYMLDSLNLPSLARGVKPGINRNDVYSLPFKLPVIEEQEATAKKIDTLCEQTRNLTEQHRNKVVTLKALKQSLLNQAFSQSEVE